MRAQIQECNFLTRKRIRFRFKRFIQQFSQCCTTARDLKLKYLLSMESLEKSFYTETFQVREASGGPLVILVAADSGVQWCKETFKDSDEVGGVCRSMAQRVALLLVSHWEGLFVHRSCSRCATSPTSPTSASSRRARRAPPRAEWSPSTSKTARIWYSAFMSFCPSVCCLFVARPQLILLPNLQPPCTLVVMEMQQVLFSYFFPAF